MIYKIIVCVLLIISFAGGWIWHDYQSALHTPAVIGSPIVIEIDKGDSFKQITDKLLAKSLNFKPFWFKIIAVQGKTFKKLKTGEYELAPGLTLPEILTLFVQGKTKQYAITFPEGWSFKEILQEVDNNPNLEHTLHDVDFEALMSLLGAVPPASIQS